MKTIIGVNGACGRMGQRIVQLAHEDKSLTLGAALEAPGHPQIGRDIGEIVGVGPLGITVQSTIPFGHRLDSIIDFSLPAGTMTVLLSLSGTPDSSGGGNDGAHRAQKTDIEAAAHHTAILMAPNMSLAVNVLFKLVQQAAELLKSRDFDVEILERHHRFKKDSPSGTALHFAKVIQEGMGQSELRHGREGLVGERPGHEIGVHAIRVGDNVGEHTIVFSTLGETMELTHRAHARDCYARGALQAAKFLAGKPPGRYTMNDVLGI